jgi:AcrR family transcriptional regulator
VATETSPARKVLAVRQARFDAGLAAFERQPISLVSILDITEAADVAKGVFHLHFRSKDEYLLAL